MTIPASLPRSSLYRAEAIVLRHAPLGEADRLVTLYTKESGKLRASARGARRIKSRLAGHLEPLTHVSLLLVRGSTLDIVTGAQAIASFAPLREELRGMARGLYAAELVDLFTEEQEPHRALFDLLLETLHLLSAGDGADLLLRRFELQLLGLLGYRPQLAACASCGGPLPAQGPVPFSAPWGGLLCARCAPRDGAARPLSPRQVEALAALQGGALQAVRGLPLAREEHRTLASLLRWYIQSILERQVRSGAFLDSLT